MIKIHIELESQEDIDKLIKAWEDGELDHLGVIDVEIEYDSDENEEEIDA